MNAQLDAFQQDIEALCEDLLDPYLAKLDKLPAVGDKEFNDPVWGTIRLSAEEVVVLDSPLLQRLRRIRQLGVVHLVYPGATHSRLEHSIGAVHQIQELVSSINAHGLVKHPQAHTHNPVISVELERTLRLAALCHDIGHGFMSHVSEYGLEFCTPVTELRNAFRDEHRRETQLSEMTAYYMVRSPAFARLLRTASELARLSWRKELPDRLGRLLIGETIDQTLVNIHELISGPFDADKLDYLTRDSLMCGVPRVTDVARLVQKVRAAEVTASDVTAPLRRRLSQDQKIVQVVGLAASGGRSLDEMALARVLMFDKVYRHQKVRAIESMVFALVLELTRLVRDKPHLIPYMLFDDEVLSLDRTAVCRIIGRDFHHLNGKEKASVNTIVELARRLRDREVFVRGLAYGAVMTGDAYLHEPEHSAGIKAFLEDCQKPDERVAFVEAVAARVRSMCVALGQDPDTLDVTGNISTYLWLSPHKAAPRTASEDTGRAHLIYPDGRIAQVEQDAAETMRWADAYVATRDLGHLFCPTSMAAHVYVAGEAELRARYGMRLPVSMQLYAKHAVDTVDELKQGLVAKGWYEELPLDLRPLPNILTRADSKSRAEHISKILSGYSGPSQVERAITDSHSKSTIHEEQVLAYVRQFKDDELIDTALEVLKNIKVIGRHEGNAALRQFVTEHPEFRGGSLCPLGAAKDSSSLLTYYVGDTASAFDLTIQSLPEALNAPRPIIFVDDFIGTGTQLVDIVEAWLDTPRSKNTHEVRQPLTPALAQRLRESQTAMVFVAGMDAAVEHARGALTELGMHSTVWVAQPEAMLPFLDTLNLPRERVEAFKTKCAEVAESILPTLWGKEREPAWIQDRLLGYGNWGLLLTSTFNTQTATLTCLWAQSSSSDWQPFLPRRTKE